MNWNNMDIPLPKDGSIVDIILGEREDGIALLCAIVENRKLMLDGMDITKHVKKWHKVPDVIYRNNRIFWDS